MPSSTKYTPLPFGAIARPNNVPPPCSRHVNRFDCRLPTARRRFDHIAVACIYGENVAVRRDRQPQRLVDRATPRDSCAGTRIVVSKERIGNNGDPVVQRIGDVETAIECKGQSRRPNHQRRGVGPLPESRQRWWCGYLARIRRRRSAQHNALHASMSHHGAVGCHRPIKNVSHEQYCREVQIERGHVPRPIDSIACTAWPPDGRCYSE